MFSFRFLLLISFFQFFFGSCKEPELREVSVQDFTEFVEATGYLTDAEHYGWSFIQKDVLDYLTAEGVNWKNPTGQAVAQPNQPVTQISYNDALAYADWADAQIPTYEQYWNLVSKDKRAINTNGTHIFDVGNSNIVGNVWEITMPDESGQLRLAGGSYLCNDNSCNGTSPERKLHVSWTTGNSHIGMVVME